VIFLLMFACPRLLAVDKHFNKGKKLNSVKNSKSETNNKNCSFYT
jgi:hypothetical protein